MEICDGSGLIGNKEDYTLTVCPGCDACEENAKNDEGLYNKYRAFNRKTGEEVDGFFFLLKPGKDVAARVALRAYANHTEDMKLWRTLTDYLNRIEKIDKKV